ncbi:MAG: hypothetical protein U1B77_04535 [Dehalococcoidales bacterium]|nr:hypothetical protein [Dehalococcoidales bacterium]
MTDEKKPADLPHVFEPLTDDMCKCFRWKDDPIHIGGVKVPEERPSPVLSK